MHAVEKPKVVVICGPTGIGKTAAAIRLARFFKTEIVNADSMQIYRKMDIGTAKPTPAEQTAVRHHMLDVLDPDQGFDAKQYAALAHENVMGLVRRRMTPFIVGGTGLYIKALLHGLFESRTVPKGLRTELTRLARQEGSEALHRMLEDFDPATARRIHVNDTYRIVRALEVYQSTGKPLSHHQRLHGFQNQRYHALKIGLKQDRAVLYARIEERVDRMLAQGLMAEVAALLAAGYSPALKSMQAIGYRHMIDVIEQRLSLDEAVRILKRDTRRYAKRQMTWFGADPEMIWFEPQNVAGMQSHIQDFLAA